MPSKKSFHRTDRVSAQLRRELGALVRTAVDEYGLPSVSVSDVEVTRDMAHAKELRYELAHVMKLRHVPELHFHYDDSVDRGERIDNLLRDLPPPSESE